MCVHGIVHTEVNYLRKVCFSSFLLLLFEKIWNRTCKLDLVWNLNILLNSRSMMTLSFLPLLQTLLPSTSGTGTDKGLVFILRPEQSMCSWYLETLDAEPVQNVAIPLSYSERGNLSVFNSLLLPIMWDLFMET